MFFKRYTEKFLPTMPTFRELTQGGVRSRLSSSLARLCADFSFLSFSLNRLIAWGLISCKLFPPALLHSFTRKTFVRRSSSVLFFFPLSRRDLSARRCSSSHRSDSPRTLGHNQTSPRSQTSTPRPSWRKCSPGSDPETFDPRQTRHRYLEREEDVPLGHRSTYRERTLR